MPLTALLFARNLRATALELVVDPVPAAAEVAPSRPVRRAALRDSWVTPLARLRWRRLERLLRAGVERRPRIKYWSDVLVLAVAMLVGTVIAVNIASPFISLAAQTALAGAGLCLTLAVIGLRNWRHWRRGR